MGLLCTMIKKNGEQFSVHASNMGDDNEGAIGNLPAPLVRSLGSRICAW